MKLTTKVLFSTGIICGAFAGASIIALRLAHHRDNTTPSADIVSEISEPVTPENMENITVMNRIVDTAIALSDSQALAMQSTNIALVRIDSLDGANNYSEVTQQYVSPYTYGQMTLLQNIQGELSSGKNYEFYRLGGTLPAEQYYAGTLSAEQNAKRLELQAARGESDEGKYIKDYAMDDVEIEAGKTYLAYLVPENSYYGMPDTYAIIGFQGGLREARQTDGVWQVLNNFTGEWEELESVPM